MFAFIEAKMQYRRVGVASGREKYRVHTLRRIWSKQEGGHNHSKTLDDLERGQELMDSPASEECPSSLRTSYADSEFSQKDFPVSPESYQDGKDFRTIVLCEVINLLVGSVARTSVECRNSLPIPLRVSSTT